MEIKVKIRAAAILNRNNKFLLHKLKDDCFWNAVGGKVEPEENAKECIIREIKEELDWIVLDLTFLGIVENFFEINNQTRYKEIIFYFRIVDYSGDNFEEKETTENGKNYIFKFFTLDEISKIKVKPNIYPKLLENRIQMPFYLLNFDT